MIKNVKKSLLGVLMLLLTSSCLYYPRLTDIPLIREKGDTRVEAGVLLLPPDAHASVSHGLTKNIAIQVAGNRDGDVHRYAQGSAGFFKNRQDKIVIEAYGGFGYGYSESVKMSNPGKIYGNYQIYFTQFNYGDINRGKRGNLEYGFGLKTGYMYSKMTENGYYNVMPRSDFENKYPSVLNMNNIIVEPTTFIRCGGKNLKFQTGIGVCWVFQINHTDKKYPFFLLSIGLGFSYSFNVKNFSKLNKINHYE